MSEGLETESSTSTRPNTSLLLLMASVSFVLLAAIMLFAGNKSASAFSTEQRLAIQNAKVEVLRIQIQEQFIKPRIVFGQLEPVQQSDIGFELSGQLQLLSILEGEDVKAGQVLASLDKTRLNAQQNELESVLVRAQAEAKLAKLSTDRIEELVKRKLEPEQRLDEALAQLDASNAAVNEVKARLKSLLVEIEKSTLIAPFSGQVVRQYVDAGTVVSAGQAVFSILGEGGLEARFGLPEKTAFGLRAGQDIDLFIHERRVNAKVKSIAQQRNLATRTIDAVFSVSNESLSGEQRLSRSIVSGDLISLSVDIPKGIKGTWVPISALASGVRGMWTLYVVDDEQKIQTRLVSIEYSEAERAYVSGAIVDGERVVVSGIHRLAPKQTVKNILEVSTSLSSAVQVKR